MPIYQFICDACGAKIEDIRPMSQSRAKTDCAKCGKEMRRDFSGEHVHTSADSYDTPLHSDSLAISPDQVVEHQRLFPNIKIDSECRPVFDNYRQHDDYLKKTGHVKLPGKQKRRATKIR